MNVSVTSSHMALEFTPLSRPVRHLASSLTTAPILITGECGSGKSTLARQLHAQSSRADGPLAIVHCAALPRAEVELELFGASPGTPRRAASQPAGAVERANGGTLFLDEVDELPWRLQTKLSSWLEASERAANGTAISPNRNFNVIATTHQSLAELCVQGRFRADLYELLSAQQLRVPPLRERLAELPEFARKILARWVTEGEPPTELTTAALQALEQHTWPGNLRELERVLEHSVAICQNRCITPADLAMSLAASMSSSPPRPAPTTRATVTETTPLSSDPPHFVPWGFLGCTWEEIEREVLRQTLAAHHNNKAQTARVLGISEKTVYNKMRRLRL